MSEEDESYSSEDTEDQEHENEQRDENEEAGPSPNELGKALEGLLTRLLPHAHTPWRPTLAPEHRPSTRYLYVRCPVRDCGDSCCVDMVVGMRQLAAALTAAGWGADDLPAGPVRDVLTRPRSRASAASSAANAAAGGSTGAGTRGRGAGTRGRGAGVRGRGTRGSRGRGKSTGGTGGSGDGSEGREFVEWTDLPLHAKKAIRDKARWCWFAGGSDPGAYASVAAHLRCDHREEVGLPCIERLLRVAGGAEEEVFQPQSALSGYCYSTEPLVAPDDPDVLAFAEQLGALLDANWPWTAARRWVDDGAVPFGDNNNVHLRCPVPGCAVTAVFRMEEAYNSFKVGLRSVLKAEDIPPGLLHDALVSEQTRFGRGHCFRGWSNLPSYAQLGFIRAARWRWFDEEWHTSDPYHGLRAHFQLHHRDDPEASRLQQLLMDRKGEEPEDTTDNPNRARGREILAMMQRYRGKRPAADEGAAGGSAGGPAPLRFRL